MIGAEAAIEQTIERADRLATSQPIALRKMMEDAERELSARLKILIDREGETGRFTQAQMQMTLAQVRLTQSYVNKRMLGLTHEKAMVAVGVSVKDTINLAKRLEKDFTGIAQPLNVEQAAILNPTINATKSSLLRQHQSSVDRYGTAMIGDFEQALRRTFIMGDSFGTAVARILHDGKKAGISAATLAQAFPASFPEPVGYRARQYWAERIVRTETSYAYNAAGHATLEATRSADFPDLGKKILATFDSRTAADSVAVHGQVRKLEEMFVDGKGRRYLHPPGRPNDRETIIPWRASWEELPNTKPTPPAAKAAATAEAHGDATKAQTKKVEQQVAKGEKTQANAKNVKAPKESPKPIEPQTPKAKLKQAISKELAEAEALKLANEERQRAAEAAAKEAKRKALIAAAEERAAEERRRMEEARARRQEAERAAPKLTETRVGDEITNFRFGEKYAGRVRLNMPGRWVAINDRGYEREFSTREAAEQRVREDWDKTQSERAALRKQREAMKQGERYDLDSLPTVRHPARHYSSTKTSYAWSEEEGDYENRNLYTGENIFGVSENVRRSLTDRQLHLVERFTGDDFTQMRASQQARQSGTLTNRSNWDKETIELDDAVRERERFSPDGLETWRGIHSIEKEEVNRMLAEGSFNHWGTASTSRRPNVAQGFAQIFGGEDGAHDAEGINNFEAGRYSVVFRMRNRTGVPVETISTAGSGEYELMVSASASYQITNAYMLPPHERGRPTVVVIEGVER